MTRETQDQDELKIFMRFVETANLKVIESSITKRQPREPDIYCEIENLGGVAFELTRIVSPRIPKSVDLAYKTEKLLQSYTKNILLNEDLESFKSKYSNTLIEVKFKSDLSLQKRENLLPELFSRLLSLDSGYTGKTLNP